MGAKERREREREQRKNTREWVSKKIQEEINARKKRHH